MMMVHSDGDLHSLPDLSPPTINLATTSVALRLRVNAHTSADNLTSNAIECPGTRIPWLASKNDFGEEEEEACALVIVLVVKQKRLVQLYLGRWRSAPAATEVKCRLLSADNILPFPS